MTLCTSHVLAHMDAGWKEANSVMSFWPRRHILRSGPAEKCNRDDLLRTGTIKHVRKLSLLVSVAETGIPT